jgi:protein CpxP
MTAIHSRRKLIPMLIANPAAATPEGCLMKTGMKSLLIAGLLANAALIAQAQTTPAAAAPPMAPASSAKMAHGMHHEGGMHGGMKGDMKGSMQGRMDPAKMQAMVAKHLAELKTKLKITAAQEGAWGTFTEAMKPPAGMTPARPDRAEIDKLPLPERIDKMRALRAQHMSDRQANMEKREDAAKAFYATLNADQKKTMDAEHSKMMHRWGDRMRHGMGH